MARICKLCNHIYSINDGPHVCPPPDNGGWLPIASAPKDGTDVIVGYDNCTVWIVHLAFYRDGSEGWNGEENLPAEDIGWWSYVKYSNTQEMLNDYRTPTHWITCPKIPKKYGV